MSKIIHGNHNRKVHFGCGLIGGAIIALYPAALVYYNHGLLAGLGAFAGIVLLLASLGAAGGDRFWTGFVHLLRILFSGRFR
ncbi:MAG: hypothetical protein R3F11_09155 [Verrucomicrobiales bacterium]